MTADRDRPQTTVTSGRQDGAGPEMASPPEVTGQPAGVAERMRHVFHELHADGRNAQCTICDGQYEDLAR